MHQNKSLDICILLAEMFCISRLCDKKRIIIIHLGACVHGMLTNAYLWIYDSMLVHDVLNQLCLCFSLTTTSPHLPYPHQC